MASGAATYLFAYLAALVISASVSFFALRRRALPGAGPFAVLAFAQAAWTAAFLFQAFAPDLADKLLWNSAQYTAALLAALAYLGFALGYTGRRSGWLGLWAAAALGLAVLLWLDGQLGIFRVQPRLEPGQPFSWLAFSFGPVYYVLLAFLFALVAYTTYLLAVNFFSAPRIYRLQVGTVLAAVILPWGVSLLSWSGWFPPALQEVIPLSFALANLVMFWAIFRYHLFDATPIARDTLIERMRDGVIVLDRRRRIVDFNPAAREILGLSNTTSPGKFIGRELPALYQFIIHLMRTPNARAEVSLEVLGEPSRYELSATPLYDNLGALTGHLVILRDVTEQKQAEEKLQNLALTDYLTGVLNRRAFFELAGPEFERSRRYRRPLSFILIDIDHFKKVNDTYGHQAGDLVLEGLARTCQNTLREPDKLARYGGEEFVVMLPETDANGARQTAERLRRLVEAMVISTPRGPLHVTISLGVAACPTARSGLTLDHVLAMADRALYQAKQSGRNQVCVAEDAYQLELPTPKSQVDSNKEGG